MSDHNFNKMILKFCVLFTLVIWCYGQNQGSENQTGNPCISKRTCGDCITADPECAWCSQDDSSPDENRCDYAENLVGRCADKHIINPAQEMIKIQDENLGTVKEGEDIQIKPQEVHLKLRPNTQFSLVVDFKQALNYPVDLYFLVDLTKFSEDYFMEKIADLGSTLSGLMVKFPNFRIGFGTFVDILPKKKPCDGCAVPYDFRNHMPLTSSAATFDRFTRFSGVHGTRDAPIGTLDAIMQAIVCKEKVGWRETSHKILVFATNRGFPYDPVGNLHRFVDYNSSYCNLDDNGYYTLSRGQQSPSISQINQKIQENGVSIIFAVTSSQVPVYERLSSLLEGSRAGNIYYPSTIRDLVFNHDRSASTVEMQDNAGSNIQVTYHSKCFGNERKKTNICRGLKAEAENCPSRCDAFRDCVECQIFPDDNDVPPQVCAACTFITIGVDKVEVKDDNEKLCVFRDDKDCQFTFKYKLDADDQPNVHAQRTKDCPEPASIFSRFSRSKRADCGRED